MSKSVRRKREKKTLYEQMIRPATVQEQLASAKQAEKANFKQWMFAEERHSKTLDLLSTVTYYFHQRLKGSSVSDAEGLALMQAREHLYRSLRGEPRPVTDK